MESLARRAGLCTFPILESRQGCWVGWPGVADASPEPFYNDAGALLHPVTLSEYDYEAFYEGFSNATLWPLYHDLIVPPTYHREWWTAYREVNSRFAEHAAAVAAPGATVWVQDYQLQLVPGILRQLRPDVRIGFLRTSLSHTQIFSGSCPGATKSSADYWAPMWWAFSSPPMPTTSYS